MNTKCWNGFKVNLPDSKVKLIRRITGVSSATFQASPLVVCWNENVNHRIEYDYERSVTAIGTCEVFVPINCRYLYSLDKQRVWDKNIKGSNH